MGRFINGSRRIGDSSVINDIFPYFLYLLVVERVDPRIVSPFVGISPSMLQASWAFPFVCSLPTSILEPAADLETRLGRRVSGAGYRAFPISVESLLKQQVDWTQPFCILISSSVSVGKQLDPWIERQAYRALHVSSNDVKGTIRPPDLSLARLQKFSIENS